MRNIEEDIQEYLKWEMRPQTVELWGDSFPNFEPPLIKEIDGDGLQIMWLQSIDDRPFFYLLRMDGDFDYEDENRDEEEFEIMLEMIENEFGSSDEYRKMDKDMVDDFDEERDGNLYVNMDSLDFEGKLRYKKEDADIITEEQFFFPRLGWSGGTWDTLANFKGLDYVLLFEKALEYIETRIEDELTNPSKYTRTISLSDVMRHVNQKYESHTDIPEFVFMNKIREALDMTEWFDARDEHCYYDGNYEPWLFKREDYPDLSYGEFERMAWQPRIEAVKKTIEFIKNN